MKLTNLAGLILSGMLLDKEATVQLKMGLDIQPKDIISNDKKDNLVNILRTNKDNILTMAALRSRKPIKVSTVSILTNLLKEKKVNIQQVVDDQIIDLLAIDPEFTPVDWYTRETNEIATAIIRGDRIIVHGRPGSGRKTAVAIGIAKALLSGYVNDFNLSSSDTRGLLVGDELGKDTIERHYTFINNVPTLGKFSRINDATSAALKNRSIIIAEDIDDIQPAIPDSDIDTIRIKIDEPGIKETGQILKVWFYKITGNKITQDEAEEMTTVAAKMDADMANPMKSIHALQTIMKDKKSTVTPQEYIEHVHKLTGTSSIFIGLTRSSVKKISTILKNNVIGQDEAINSITAALAKRTLRKVKRPTSFLFAGQTGLGKSLCAKTLANALFGHDKYFIRINMNEFKESHSVSQLLGAPPGYIGYNDESVADKIAKLGDVVLLLDEIEKAHPAIFDVLLQLLDEGEITSRRGTVANTKQSIIIATTNIGTKSEVQSEIGFDGHKLTMAENVEKEIKKIMKPELINRFDKIVVFKSFTTADIKKIIKVEIDRIVEEFNTDEVKLDLNEIAKRAFKDAKENGKIEIFGAREIRRIVERTIDDYITENM